MLPNLGGIDVSPVILILLILFIQAVIIPNIAKFFLSWLFLVDKPWSPMASGVAVSVRLTPKGGRDAIDGIETMSDNRAVLKIRVRAAPSEGEANAAADKTDRNGRGRPPRDVTLVTGATARIKRLNISGDGPTLVAALEKIARVALRLVRRANGS